jgi:hypothetical protein
MPPERGHSELFETTLIGQDFAIGVISIPLSLVPIRDEAATAERLIDNLGLSTAARIGARDFDQAITALVVNETVDDVLEWLDRPPRPVPIELVAPTIASAAHRELPPRLDHGRLPAKRQTTRPKRPRPPKESAKAREIEDAAAQFARQAVVPYARSPADITSLSDLVQGATELAIWLVSPRTNPFLIVEVPAGYLLIRTVQGVGEGLRRGLSEGVHYRLLQLFKVPDDWRRD